MKKLVLSVAALSLALSGCQQPQEQPVQVSAGHGIFLNNCVGCHQGGGYPPGPNSVILNSPRIQSETEFIQLLRQPPSPGMPPFPVERLSENEAHELYIFIKTHLEQQQSGQQ